MNGPVLLALCLIPAVLHLAFTYADRRGWMIYRVRTRSSAAASAFNNLQALMQPSVVHLEEAKREKKQLAPAPGDPPCDDFVYFR